jgi:hypothetical protein
MPVHRRHRTSLDQALTGLEEQGLDVIAPHEALGALAQGTPGRPRSPTSAS